MPRAGHAQLGGVEAEEELEAVQVPPGPVLLVIVGGQFPSAFRARQVGLGLGGRPGRPPAARAGRGQYGSVSGSLRGQEASVHFGASHGSHLGPVPGSVKPLLPTHNPEELRLVACPGLGPQGYAQWQRLPWWASERSAGFLHHLGRLGIRTVQLPGAFRRRCSAVYIRTANTAGLAGPTQPGKPRSGVQER